MCGKFKQDFDLSYLIALLRLPTSSARPVVQATPGRLALALALNENALTTASMRWGFASAPGLGVRPVLHARAESMAEKPLFATAFRQTRCALPVSAYLEGELCVTLPASPVFYLAGLFQTGADDRREFTVVTRAATDDLRTAHDRMPLVLSDAMTLQSWLREGLQPAQFPVFSSHAAPRGDTRQMALF